MLGALSFGGNVIGSSLGLLLGVVTTRATLLYAGGSATELSQANGGVTQMTTSSDSSTLLTTSPSEVILRGR